MMTKLRETESARIRHRRRDHRNAITQRIGIREQRAFKKGV